MTTPDATSPDATAPGGAQQEHPHDPSVSPDRPRTPDAAWRALREGNARFVAGERPAGRTSPELRAALAHGQKPFALIFGCSDSRVSAELVFDQGLGDLFVVRTAGHVADSGVLGSIEYGVGVLGIPLVVVLGHDSCGAVLSTLEVVAGGPMPGGYVRDVIERVTPSVLRAGVLVGGTPSSEQVLVEHVRQSVEQLAERSVVVADAVRAGRCAVVGVAYQLTDGVARVVEVVGDAGVHEDEPTAAAADHEPFADARTGGGAPA